MKKTHFILVAVLLIAGVFQPKLLLAQSPQKISYQTIIRDATNKLVTSHNVGMRISILQVIVPASIAIQAKINDTKSALSETPVYVETQMTSTNANGLISIDIGSGTVVSGTIASINWANGQYFIKTETDPIGGTNYTIAGESQLLSVPYALYAASTNNVHSIGESYGGGIVFYVYDNGHHGLIAAITDYNALIRWYGGSNTNTCARADGVGAGLTNTAIIIANQGPVDGNTFAVRVCSEYSIAVGNVTYGDWYLPSKTELSLLYQQRTVVGGFASYFYWTSNEKDSDNAWEINFGSGAPNLSGKYGGLNVRPIRAF